MKLFHNPLIGAAVPVSLLAVGVVSAAFDSDRQERQAIARDTAQATVQQRLETAQAEARAALAEARYQGPCTYNPHGAIAEGMAFVGENGAPLPDGTTVCDATGGTAVVQGGVATDLARTANTAVVQQFLGW